MTIHEEITQKAANLCREINAQGKCGQQIHAMADEILALCGTARTYAIASTCADEIIANMEVLAEMRTAWSGLTPQMQDTYRTNWITIIMARIKEAK